MRLTSWIALLIAIVVAAALAVANRNAVTFSLDPLPWTIELPLYGVLFAGLVVGLVLGLGTEWWRGRRWRREARARRREVQTLAQENASLKAASGQRPPTA
jgi:putative membrane protein